MKVPHDHVQTDHMTREEGNVGAPPSSQGGPGQRGGVVFRIASGPSERSGLIARVRLSKPHPGAVASVLRCVSQHPHQHAAFFTDIILVSKQKGLLDPTVCSVTYLVSRV